ncbi:MULTISPECIES: LPS export ABC transporter permease LptF [Azorhizobium]|uniref:Putative permease n=1 Tax=Azorhizobium caulinodans (strain ATCC 43989 / DSM 5975 / JCM 20966 / LMG 6465 / NBRC 14845 / NCIMB 13405 / ORS 571) TaxID=438753 RepID=A8HVK6_AZOC5|nr:MULTISPECIES: LPS export ABC transporter permease LptF [Azorhizobium]TDT89497.1 lipopolysaccharide export system permease protein [Azorhizobium sp. AG788]BAF90323.1 putative permease precursor [Azorhizobium caulinodans ORS 571]
MGRLDRYIFSTSAVAFVGVTLVLTGMIWATQALRQLDLVTSQGQTILAFLAITSLTLPTLIMVIAPAALFIATSYTLLKLNGDSEIVVMAAAGMSPWRVLRSLMLLAVLASVFCSALSIHIVPASLRSFRDQVSRVRADVVSFVAQPGRFVNLAPGLVFHVRDRAKNGVMSGVFINDAREKEVSTYVADRGQIVEADNGIFLVLENGSIHRRVPGAASNGSVVEFQRYAFDLSALTPGGSQSGADIRPNERSFAYISNPPKDDPYMIVQPGRFREEYHKRLSAGLYPLAFFAIAAAAMARPRTTRESRGLALAAIVPIMTALQIANFAVAGQLRTAAWAVPAIYLIPLLTIIVSALVLQGWITFTLPAPVARVMHALSTRVTRLSAS